MLGTLRTLISGANNRAEGQIRDIYAIELIDQKMKQAGDTLRAAKATLATLIQRQRAEQHLASALETRVKDMSQRASQALDAGNEALAQEAAHGIAEMENELTVRNQTLDRLGQKIDRLRLSVEAGQRRLVDLKQGAISARAVRKEQQAQSRMRTTIGHQSSADEAEELIAQVLQKDDPFEQAEILKEIDEGLCHNSLADRMAAAGFGKSSKTTAADVLARLKSNS